MDMQEIQNNVKQTRSNRGFTMDPEKIYMLLAEEVGEVGSELKRIWSENYGEFQEDRLQDELADVMVLVFALANQFNIEMDEAVLKKIDQDEGRDWVSAQSG